MTSSGAGSLAELPPAPIAARLAPHPTGLPGLELTRSPAAARIGALAVEAGFFFGHFEYTRFLPLPEAWEPPDRPDLGAVQGWRNGELPETKFRHFRLDRPVASFHPCHGPKWGAHELCHRLVGWAWTPRPSLPWLAAMARLAEALPVALWYSFDEAGLETCPAHPYGSPTAGPSCPTCDTLALHGPRPFTDADHARVEAGRAWLDRELEAALAGRAGREPVHNPWGAVDLASDALAWAAAHVRRLRDPAFERLVALTGARGMAPSLDALADRVRAVAAALLDGAPLPVLGGAADWVVQDLAGRMLQVWAETDGPAARGIERLVEGLAAALPAGAAALGAARPGAPPAALPGAPPAARPGAPPAARPGPVPAALTPAVEACVAGWRVLTADYELPPAEQVFAVGYPLPGGVGRDHAQVAAGLRLALPRSRAVAGRQWKGLVADFVATDTALVRAPLARRFAADLAGQAAPRLLPALATLEAALLHPRPALGWVVASMSAPARRGGRVLTAPDVELLHADAFTLTALGLGELPAGPLAVRRGADGNARVVPLAEVAEALPDRPAGAWGTLPPSLREALLAHGVVFAAGDAG